MTRRLTTALAPLAFAAGLVATPALAFDIETMSADERSAFREEVRAYLLENPEVLMEAIAVLERRDAAAQVANDQTLVATNREALFNDGYSHVGGNPEGDITFVEFFDYKCGYCKKAHPEVQALLAADGNIRIIYKEFPILGEESLMASRFAIATQIVAGEEAYAMLHDALYEMRGNVTEQSLTSLATELGLDAKAILDGLSDPRVDEIIAENHALAQRMAISGTPTFVMGDQMVRGYVPLSGMEQIVKELREQQG
ncbi:DsbA family protein [Maritimibacter fusiformis]|uniref:DsbA family protein n=1 Tax=Maritimibacter fusiformis TaxID=2603819 RepID=A0A5D0RK52_9RHOB|nr:DsbA family protein [Maritimibacter fusiformis]TYB81803.1 DsbA family protein [Maritimibacter fusiformis]